MLSISQAQEWIQKTCCFSFKIASEVQERIVDEADWKAEGKGDIAFMVRMHVATLMLNSRRAKKRKRKRKLTRSLSLSNRLVSEGPDTI